MILPSGIKYLSGSGYRVILIAQENNLLLARKATFQTLPDAIAWKTEKMAVFSAWAENEKLRFAKKLHEYARAAMRERIRANEERRTPVYPPQPQTPPLAELHLRSRLVYVKLTGGLYAPHGLDEDDTTQVFLGCFRDRVFASRVVDHWHYSRGLAHRRHINGRTDQDDWRAEDAEREAKERESLPTLGAYLAGPQHDKVPRWKLTAKSLAKGHNKLTAGSGVYVCLEREDGTSGVHEVQAADFMRGKRPSSKQTLGAYLAGPQHDKVPRWKLTEKSLAAGHDKLTAGSHVRACFEREDGTSGLHEAQAREFMLGRRR